MLSGRQRLRAMRIEVTEDPRGGETITGFLVSFPFLLAAVCYLLSPAFSSLAKRRLGESAQAGESIAVPKDGSTGRLLSILDWAIDAPQVVFVGLLPLVAFLFAIPASPWALPAALTASVLTIAALVGILLVEPQRYVAFARTRFRFTPVAICGLFLNLVIFVILCFGLLPASEVRFAPAREILHITSIDQANPSEATVFSVRLRVDGGPEALAGRTVWIANNTYKENASIGTDPVSFAPVPCEHQDGDAWLCSPVYIGQQVDSVSVFAIYPLLADDNALAAIITYHVTKPGPFSAPRGIDSLPPYRFKRPH